EREFFTRQESIMISGCRLDIGYFTTTLFNNPRITTIHFFVTYTGVFSSINQCMRSILLCILLLHFTIFSFAGKISGLITDNEGSPLPYASIIVKGTNKGTTANSSGRYSISLNPGRYTLVAQYVGYAKAEKSFTVTNEDQFSD